MKYYATFMTALFISMVLVAGLMRLAARLQFVDLPNERKVHASAIPRIGGVGMVLGAVAAVWLWGDISVTTIRFIVAVLIIAVFGVWDDRRELNYKIKFLGQLLATLLVVLPGDVLIDRLSLGSLDGLPHWLSVPLTIFFLLGMTNATNLSDGLDGLASGQSLLSLACVVVLAAMGDANELVLVTLAIIGGTLGFLRYNTHPALVFMGDTGSQFLGFSLGVVTIWLTQNANTALAPELPLLILGLPIIDTLTVMGQRMLRGSSPFKPDKNHFHHKLLNLGFDHYESVVVIYLVQTVFVISAYFLRYESALAILGQYVFWAFLIVVSYPVGQRMGWRLHELMPGQVSRITWKILRLKEAGWIEWIIYACITALIVGFVVVGGLALGPLAKELSVFAWVMIAAVLMTWIVRLPIEQMIQRLNIYTFVILTVYAMDKGMGAKFLLQRHESLEHFFLALAVLIGLGVYASGRKYFGVTPSDYLVMGVLIACSFLPIFNEVAHVRLAIECAVMLYGVEFLLRRHNLVSKCFSVGVTLGFLGVAISADI